MFAGRDCGERRLKEGSGLLRKQERERRGDSRGGGSRDKRSDVGAEVAEGDDQ